MKYHCMLTFRILVTLRIVIKVTGKTYLSLEESFGKNSLSLLDQHILLKCKNYLKYLLIFWFVVRCNKLILVFKMDCIADV